MRNCLAVAALALYVEGCGGSDAGTPPLVTPPAVAAVSVAPTSGSLIPLQTLQLNASTTDAAGSVLTGRTVTWSTSATSIATVSSTGLVTAAAVGTATITATSEGKNGTAAITVIPAGNATLIGAAGGTVSAMNGNVTIVIPPGALSQTTAITVDSTTLSANPLLVGTAYSLGPDGLQFASPVTLRVKYDPTKIPAGASQAGITLFGGGRDSSVQVDSMIVDSVAHVVQGKTMHFSIYQLNALTIERRDFENPNFSYPNSITLCVGMPQEVSIGAASVAGFREAPMDVKSSVPAAASVSGNISGWTSGATTVINPLSPGSSVITFRMSLPVRDYRYLLLKVNVINTNPPCAQPAIALTRDRGATDDVVAYRAGVITPLTTDGKSRFPALGLGGGVGDPFSTTATNLNTVNFNWVGTTAPPVTTTGPLGTYFMGVAFVNRTTAVVSQQQTDGTADLYRYSQNGARPLRLTNLRGNATSPAVASNGTLFFSYYPIPLSANLPGHIYSAATPPGDNPVPVTTPTRVTLGNLTEIQPAISQNGAFLSYTQIPPDFSYSRIFYQDLSQPSVPPVGVSPVTGYAFSPSWCGSEVLYYTWSASQSGPYQPFRWEKATGTLSLMSGLSGFSYPDLSVARTTGDDGLHTCPR